MSSTRPPAPFHLMRHFSLASLAGVLLVVAVLLWVFDRLATAQLLQHGERANTDLTQVFANTVWDRHRPVLQATHGLAAPALRAHPAMPALAEDLRRTMRRLSVAKVKLYNRQGITLYSTDPKQVGENKADNAGFQRALAGQAASLLLHRERFDAFEGTLNDRDLIASYLPLRATGDQSVVEGVIEVYSDVTALAKANAEARWQVVGWVLAALVALYLFLLLLVGRADRILRLQDDERAQQARRIHHQAFHDALTGLPNRASFLEQLGAAIAASPRQTSAARPGCALLFIDLDRFKAVNDGLGHSAGDALLQAAALRLRQCLRDGDQLFRVGGDEFTAILTQLHGADEAAAVARRITDEMARPFPAQGQPLCIGATVGVALCPDHGRAVDLLLRRADAAMYRAKSAGRGRHAFFGDDGVAGPAAQATHPAPSPATTQPSEPPGPRRLPAPAG